MSDIPRWLSATLAIVGAGALCVVLLALSYGLSRGLGATSWLQLTALLLLGVGLVTLPFRETRRFGPVRAGLVLLLGIAVTRVALFDGGPHARLAVLHGDGRAESRSRWVNRLLDERDASLVGASLLIDVGVLDAHESRGFADELEAGYARQSGFATRLPSPVAATYLGLQSSDATDAVIVPAQGPSTRDAVVFLHGFAGPVALFCLEVARAAHAAGATTVCPSMGPHGDWWSLEGERTLRVTLHWLRARGFTRIVLAGLSNGAIGGGMLAPRVSDQLVGLLLISGAPPDAAPTGLPALLITGRSDGMVPVRLSRDYASREPSSARLVELEGTHFVLLEQHVRIRREIAHWLRARFR